MKVKICVETGCKNAQTTKGYCRLHYLKNWREIKEVAQKKSVDRLNKYVEGICNKFPERYMDVIRREIRNGKGESANPSSDEEVPGDMPEDVYNALGYAEDDNLDKLISRIKLDKDF